MSRVLNVIISHQRRAELERVLEWWAAHVPGSEILVAYGGSEAEFEKLSDIPRVFVADERLRIRDQQRGKQSHGGIFRAVAEYLQSGEGAAFTHVYYVEFDHLPLVPDFAARLLERAAQEQADVLAHHLHRVDRTSNVHYLYHLADPAFLRFWERISVREAKDVVLKVVVTGSFWTRDAFLAVARQKEEIAAYVEIYVATLAHHLGYRVRSLKEQDRCVSTMPLVDVSMDDARAIGCWTIHPIKTLPIPAVARSA